MIAVTFWLTVPEAVFKVGGQAVSQMHLACAEIIGTALALVLTLSIVPAQRAADVFSSAILKLYARDRGLLVAFGVLSFLTLTSIALGTSLVFEVQPRFALAFQIVALGAAFDAVRAFYTRNAESADPIDCAGPRE